MAEDNPNQRVTEAMVLAQQLDQMLAHIVTQMQPSVVTILLGVAFFSATVLRNIRRQYMGGDPNEATFIYSRFVGTLASAFEGEAAQASPIITEN